MACADDSSITSLSAYDRSVLLVIRYWQIILSNDNGYNLLDGTRHRWRQSRGKTMISRGEITNRGGIILENYFSKFFQRDVLIYSKALRSRISLPRTHSRNTCFAVLFTSFFFSLVLRTKHSNDGKKKFVYAVTMCPYFDPAVYETMPSQHYFDCVTSRMF